MMYKFRSEDAVRFAAEQGIPANKSGNELTFFECPYCRGGANGDTSTFSINLTTGQFECKRASCGAKGNMITLSQDFNFSLGKDADVYYQIKQKQFTEFKRPAHAVDSSAEAISYFSKRGIDAETVRRYKITTKKDASNIIVFSFYSADGEKIEFLKYRKTDFDKLKDKNKEWCERNCKPILYGMECCTSDSKRLYITEGQIDSLSLASVGIKNAVSVPTGAKGFTWIPHCWDWIHKNFTEIVVFGDCENGEISLLAEISKRFAALKVYYIEQKDYNGCKDANEILQKCGREYLKEIANKAVIVPNKALIPAELVEDDTEELKRFKTHINAIDKLCGGIVCGGLTIITGKAGEGKSTLASQMLAFAIEQGFKCMAYSGELRNADFMKWLYFQLAGSANVTAEDENKEHHIKDDAKAAMRTWISGKLWIYDVDKVLYSDDSEFESLLKTVEQAILQYDCKVILLDNLMTALDLVVSELTGANKYELQGAFVRKLALLAKVHKVAIILVAHKRKNNFDINENDEIAGSSEIANYAQMIISYGKYTSNDIRKDETLTDDMRKLSVSKQRINGKTIYDVNLRFEESTKRIFGLDDKIPKYEFGWCRNEDENKDDGFVPVQNSLEDMPFD